MLKETTTPLFGNDRYEGYCVDVIEKLAKMLGFNYTFTVQEDGANGNFNKATNKWNGMIGEIVDGVVIIQTLFNLFSFSGFYIKYMNTFKTDTCWT